MTAASLSLTSGQTKARSMLILDLPQTLQTSSRVCLAAVEMVGDAKTGCVLWRGEARPASLRDADHIALWRVKFTRSPVNNSGYGRTVPCAVAATDRRRRRISERGAMMALRCLGCVT